jgi:arsenate reductase (thioredoxin)
MHTILFVCVHNAGRSQMAAAFARHSGGRAVRVLSGGSQPARDMHPQVIEAMREVGIELAAERPRGFSDHDVAEADAVVTMGCGDACPIFPGKLYVDWAVEDPAGKPIEDVRAIRDEIRERVAGLLAELGVDARA